MGRTVFEVDPGPSDLALILAQYRNANYADLPILILLVLHAVWFGLLVWNRHSLIFTSLQFCVSCYAIFVSDAINGVLESHWQKLGFSQNYFDHAYFFVVAFWSLPLSIVAGLVILSLFSDLCRSLAVHRYFSALVNGETKEKLKAD